jgi:hypothetical protein
MKRRRIVARTLLRWLMPTVLIGGVAAFVAASSSNPIAGLTGAPSEDLCTDCHSDFPVNSGPGSLVLTVPASYEPGDTYTIKVRISQTGQRRWGFQITALDSSVQKAGTFIITDSGHTQSQYSAFFDRYYVNHKSLGTFPDSLNGPIEWEMEWQAPSGDVGPVTFYCAGNAANYSMDPTGDYIYAVTTTVPFEPSPSFLTVTPDTMIAKDPVKLKFLKPVKRRKGLYPNWANLMYEVVTQGGFQPNATESDSAGGMRIGRSYMYLANPIKNKWKPLQDSARVYGWVRLTKWNPSKGLGTSVTALQKTLEDKTGKHTAQARGLDSTGNPGNTKRKLLVKEHTKLPPKKHNNVLFAELVALKLNIAASQLGKTPDGFGELVFDVDGNPCDELSIVEISAKADSMMTYWKVYSREEYDSLWSAISRINRAFVGKLDTLSFEAGEKLVLKGAVDLASVPFLREGSTPARRLSPTTSLTESSEEYEFEDDEWEEWEAAGVPVVAKLYQNYPNPFNPSTAIRFRLREYSRVTLKVFDLLGREVATLFDGEEFDEGFQAIRFTGSDLASGVYLYRLHAEGVDSGERTVETHKMLLVK